jgi:hypothetical protein
MESHDKKKRRFSMWSRETTEAEPKVRTAGGLRLVEPAPAGGPPIPTIGRMIARTALLADQALKRKR